MFAGLGGLIEKRRNRFGGGSGRGCATLGADHIGQSLNADEGADRGELDPDMVIDVARDAGNAEFIEHGLLVDLEWRSVSANQIGRHKTEAVINRFVGATAANGGADEA